MIGKVNQKTEEQTTQALPSSDSLSSQQSSAGIQFVDFERILRDGIPSIDWLVEGWLASSELAILGGAPKTGKTTAAYDLAVCLASGIEWQGHRVPAPCRVLVLDEEQPERIAARTMLRIAKGYGVAPWRDGHLMLAVGQGLSFSQKGHVKLQRLLMAEKPDVVVVDSLAKFFAGVDESSNDGIAQCNMRLNSLRRASGAAFIVLHHVTKGAFGYTSRGERLGVIRGGGEHVGNADAVWFSQRTKDKKLQELSVVVRRDTETDEFPVLGLSHQKPEGPTGPIRLVCEWRGIDGSATAVEHLLAATLYELHSGGELQVKDINAQVGGSASNCYRARKQLSKEGFIESPKKGIWRITEKGQEEVEAMIREVLDSSPTS